MKSLILIFSFVFLNVASAQQVPWIEDYGTAPNAVVESLSDESLNWLFELVIPEQSRTNLPKEARRSFDVHTYDTYGSFHHPDTIGLKSLNPDKLISGKITYAGWFRKGYNYSVLRDTNGTYVMNVRVFLMDAKGNDKENFAAKIAKATEIWNSYRPKMDFNYRFQFELADSVQTAHYVVQVLDSTRGPYDSFWGRNWPAVVIAHEIGHMMGLGDEYYTITGGFNCLKTSLMCLSYAGDLHPYHYYFILRRLVGKNF